jgi:hypothetical protein
MSQQEIYIKKLEAKLAETTKQLIHVAAINDRCIRIAMCCIRLFGEDGYIHIPASLFEECDSNKETIMSKLNKITGEYDTTITSTEEAIKAVIEARQQAKDKAKEEEDTNADV